MQPTPEQLALIERQLGRPPRGLAAIAYATPDGVPVVLQMRSLMEGKPFPTLFWLCSQDLDKALARIEASGWIKSMEEELQQDAQLRARFHAQQQAYVDLRWQLMTAEDRAVIEAQGFTERFNTLGIGGIAQWDKVRCLHMQYAHHLVAENLIGQRLDAEFALHELAIQI
ncbi:DUF501 domain-containing protein [Nitrincola tapanii]|uniref:DUF501 domain-containing protein n=1 Tax=Nitrincola tapanii TaxID=1708751 RepID=A0A5A9W302_9GAMM|nr:DUF501 domain-containing protein [Nitrincola tapanii]KAA0874485.1 DUF501 domain-containing protein [Nitrincola tapanii]